MQVQARGINVKGHTTHYKVAGKWRTRKEAVHLARQGKIEGVTIRNGSNDEMYLASKPYSYYRLYDLPVVPQEQIQNRRRRSR